MVELRSKSEKITEGEMQFNMGKEFGKGYDKGRQQAIKDLVKAFRIMKFFNAKGELVTNNIIQKIKELEVKIGRT